MGHDIRRGAEVGLADSGEVIGVVSEPDDGASFVVLVDGREMIVPIEAVHRLEETKVILDPQRAMALVNGVRRNS